MREYILAKDMMPPKPSLLLLETVEFGELALESESASESLASFKLFGRSNFWDLWRKMYKCYQHFFFFQPKAYVAVGGWCGLIFSLFLPHYPYLVGKKNWKRRRKKVEMHLCIKAFILLPFRTHCKFVCNTTLMDLGVEKNFCFVRKQQRKKKPNVIKHCWIPSHFSPETASFTTKIP